MFIFAATGDLEIAGTLSLTSKRKLVENGRPIEIFRNKNFAVFAIFCSLIPNSNQSKIQMDFSRGVGEPLQIIKLLFNVFYDIESICFRKMSVIFWTNRFFILILLTFSSYTLNTGLIQVFQVKYKLTLWRFFKKLFLVFLLRVFIQKFVFFGD